MLAMMPSATEQRQSAIRADSKGMCLTGSAHRSNKRKKTQQLEPCNIRTHCLLDHLLAQHTALGVLAEEVSLVALPQHIPSLSGHHTNTHGEAVHTLIRNVGVRICAENRFSCCIALLLAPVSVATAHEEKGQKLLSGATVRSRGSMYRWSLLEHGQSKRLGSDV
eukprot:TRINITY_DN1192_c0_g1_i2.p1 TRINITY_DN1192_c0_g1~~TRINITY_DN1192_c0_g1_i2.p1  ORF type:complete len:165 (+),score=8.43 TRINITY_DN1192_c0_g1_i2:427-921(+)